MSIKRNTAAVSAALLTIIGGSKASAAGDSSLARANAQINACYDAFISTRVNAVRLIKLASKKAGTSNPFEMEIKAASEPNKYSMAPALITFSSLDFLTLDPAETQDLCYKNSREMTQLLREMGRTQNQFRVELAKVPFPHR